MKNLTCFILTMIALFQFNNTYAQEGDMTTENDFKYNKNIKISPFHFTTNAFVLSYEQYWNNRNYSILVSPGMILDRNGSEQSTGLITQVQFRYYLNQLVKGKNKTLNMSSIGFYTAPYTQYLFLNEFYDHYTWDEIKGVEQKNTNNRVVNSIEGGLLMGLQFDITSRFIIDLFVGGGVKYADVADDFVDDDRYRYNSPLDRAYTGVVPRGGLLVGFSF